MFQPVSRYTRIRRPPQTQSLAWLAALLPLITIHVCYALAAMQGHVEACLPYIDSCSSISAAGRQAPEKWLFKLGMVPTAVVVAMLWWGLWRWRQRAGPSALRRTLASLPWVGATAAVFLLLYTFALGEAGDSYRMMRRTGATLAFCLTYLAQLQFVFLLRELAGQPARQHLAIWQQRLLLLVSAVLLLGLTSLIIDAVDNSLHDRVEDAFEWWFALCLTLYFAGLARLLKAAHAA